MAEDGIIEEEGNQEVPPPSFDFGVTLIQLPNGEGLKIEPHDSPEFQRTPTINDLLSAAAQLDSHIRAINTAGKILEITNRSQPKIVPGRKGH